MPAPRHFRLTFTGVFGAAAAPVEEWSMGVSLIAVPDGTYSQEGLKSAVGALGPLWGSHVASYASTQARHTNTTLALVGVDGKYERNAAGAYQRAELATDVAGVSTTLVPLQIALAVSLHSNYDGPTGRGRFYVPTPGIAVQADGTYADTTAANAASAMKGFVDAINAAVAGGGGTWGAPDSPIGRVCVASGGSIVKGLAPALHPVTRVSVGEVPDTQRRRRSDLLELRKFASVA